MNNKPIIEFGFRIILRIMEISEGVIRLGLRPRWITPSWMSIILHKILSLESVAHYLHFPNMVSADWL